MKSFLIIASLSLLSIQQAQASIYADLDKKTVTGVNDGLPTIHVKLNSETFTYEHHGAATPPGTDNKNSSEKLTVPMNAAGEEYYQKKYNNYIKYVKTKKEQDNRKIAEQKALALKKSRRQKATCFDRDGRNHCEEAAIFICKTGDQLYQMGGSSYASLLLEGSLANGYGGILKGEGVYTPEGYIYIFSKATQLARRKCYGKLSQYFNKFENGLYFPLLEMAR